MLRLRNKKANLELSPVIYRSGYVKLLVCQYFINNKKVSPKSAVIGDLPFPYAIRA